MLSIQKDILRREHVAIGRSRDRQASLWHPPCLPSLSRVRLLLVALSVACLLTAGGGCAQLHRTPDQCGFALDRCELVRELDCILDCDCPGCGAYCDASPAVMLGDSMHCGCSLSGDCGVAISEAPVPLAAPRACGPLPIRYRPPQPPTFLSVPTQPVLATSPPDVPSPPRGSVEVGYRRELAFPGGL